MYTVWLESGTKMTRCVSLVDDQKEKKGKDEDTLSFGKAISTLIRQLSSSGWHSLIEAAGVGSIALVTEGQSPKWYCRDIGSTLGTHWRDECSCECDR